jgi:hypothetical protein
MMTSLISHFPEHAMTQPLCKSHDVVKLTLDDNILKQLDAWRQSVDRDFSRSQAVLFMLGLSLDFVSQTLVSEPSTGSKVDKIACAKRDITPMQP